MQITFYDVNFFFIGWIHILSDYITYKLLLIGFLLKIWKYEGSTIRSYDLQSYLPPMILCRISILTTLVLSMVYSILGLPFPLIKICYFLKINKNCFIYGACQETCFVKNHRFYTNLFLDQPIWLPYFLCCFCDCLIKSTKR